MVPLRLVLWLPCALAQIGGTQMPGTQMPGSRTLPPGMLPGFSGQNYEQHWKDLDGNGDGKVDFEEIRAYGHHKIIAREYLDKMDLDKNTWLSLEEYTKGGGVAEPEATAEEATRRLKAAKPPPAAAPPPPPQPPLVEVRAAPAAEEPVKGDDL